ncbi:MAG: hypothetical protein M1829_001330 [Trizodia sp. TS-e1964]|nr:MAG: hypothetical protein M1829_001330 [Trizodia sp. TS-e1964]
MDVKGPIWRWASSLGMEPSVANILIALAITLSLPILLHIISYRSASSNTLPSFLLLGPSGSGKTSLLTLFERGKEAPTHTSQAPLTVEVSLPTSTITASSQYRSANDPTLQISKRLLLVDTPGHGKLRRSAIDKITSLENLRGIIFTVDASALTTGSRATEDDGIREAAEYLHDALLILQRRLTGSRTSRAPKEIPLLVAANKSDLFTALPAALVKKALEAEITNIRSTRSRGLTSLDPAVGADLLKEVEQERDWLGNAGDVAFEFKQMKDVNVSVEIISGNVLGPDGPNVAKWWEWIGNCL